MKNQEKKELSLEAIKAKLKGKLGNKENKKSSNGEIYIYPLHCISNKQKSNWRNNHRNNLDDLHFSICEAGLNNPDLIKDLKNLANDYKIYYKIQDFSIENFTNRRGENKLKMKALLEALKDYLEIS